MLTPALLLLTCLDGFDRLEGPILNAVPASADALSRKVLTSDDLGTLPNVLPDTRAALVVVETSDGNLARMLVVPAFRKQPAGKGEPLPILVVERFDSFEAGPDGKKVARGRDLTLFDGYRLDLDSGQIVPDGQGGDVQFLAGEPAGPRLIPLSPTKLFTLTKKPAQEPAELAVPSPGRVVVPADATGRYRMFSNGQGTGLLDLRREDGNTLSGRLRSDQTGTVYKVSGEVGPDPPHRVRFRVDLPRAVQEYDGFLFVDGKGAIAGSFTLLDRPFGFFALREGGNVAPGDAIDATLPAGSKGRQMVLRIAPDAWMIADRSVEDAAVSVAVQTAAATDPETTFVILAPLDTPADRIARLVGLLQKSGVRSIRIDAAPPR